LARPPALPDLGGRPAKESQRLPILPIEMARQPVTVMSRVAVRRARRQRATSSVLHGETLTMIPSILSASSLALALALAGQPEGAPTTDGSADRPIVASAADDAPKTKEEREKARQETREKNRAKSNDKAKQDGAKGGQIMQNFSAKDMSGKKVEFPDDFKGKVVLIDFWATWCGPCIAEMPHVVEVYEKYRGEGLEVIGITLDNDGAEQKIKDAEARLKMNWPQIYQGGGWKTPLAKKYGINSIPKAYLVDGSTGKIIAEGNALRGDKLDPAVKAALESVKATAGDDKAKDKGADKGPDKSSDKGSDKGKDKSKDTGSGGDKGR
jgi:thiol-disulfide isomerase/thioredoxin